MEDALTYVFTNYFSGMETVTFLSWAEVFELDDGAANFLEELGMNKAAGAAMRENQELGMN